MNINAIANWMMQQGYATGHGDTVEDLLKELEWQVQEREREACAKLCENIVSNYDYVQSNWFAEAIRQRGKE